MPPKIPLLDPETQALLHFGWFRLIDGVLLAVLVLTAAVGMAWWTFGAPSTGNILGLVLSAIVVLLIWCVMLLYRACYFILKMRSAVELMPNTAARIAVKFIEDGGLSSSTNAPAPRQQAS